MAPSIEEFIQALRDLDKESLKCIATELHTVPSHELKHVFIHLTILTAMVQSERGKQKRTMKNSVAISRQQELERSLLNERALSNVSLELPEVSNDIPYKDS